MSSSDSAETLAKGCGKIKYLRLPTFSVIFVPEIIKINCRSSELWKDKVVTFLLYVAAYMANKVVYWDTV